MCRPAALCTGLHVLIQLSEPHLPARTCKHTRTCSPSAVEARRLVRCPLCVPRAGRRGLLRPAAALRRGQWGRRGGCLLASAASNGARTHATQLSLQRRARPVRLLRESTRVAKGPFHRLVRNGMSRHSLTCPLGIVSNSSPSWPPALVRPRSVVSMTLRRAACVGAMHEHTCKHTCNAQRPLHRLSRDVACHWGAPPEAHCMNRRTLASASAPPMRQLRRWDRTADTSHL